MMSLYFSHHLLFHLYPLKTSLSIHLGPSSSILYVFHSITFFSPTDSKFSTLVLVKFLSVWLCGQMEVGPLEVKRAEDPPGSLSIIASLQNSWVLSERTNELQWVFHLKMGLMLSLRLQITLQILITAAWQWVLNQWTLACWTSSHSSLNLRCFDICRGGKIVCKCC